MADSLKVSPTMIKQPAVSRHQADPQIPFQIKDVSKVNNLNVSKQTSSQNQTLLNSDGPKLLMDLLKNPENSTHFLHSLYLLQEISQLVPLDNTLLNVELEKLFNSIFLKSDHVLIELLNQSKQSSLLKGELFDWIRNTLINHPEYEQKLIQLLKSMNHMKSKESYRQSLINQTLYLKNEFKNTKQISVIESYLSKLEENTDLSKSFIEMVNELEKSVVYRPDVKRNIGIMQYNLSRYLIDSNLDDLLEYFKACLKDEFNHFHQLFNDYLDKPVSAYNPSSVIEKITQVLELEVSHSTILGLTHDKIESIVISLLSSPSHFVPLLHFVLPMQSELLQAYSEVWIDVKNDNNQNSNHVLCAIEIEKFGHFEIELWLVNDRIRCDVYCPTELVEQFKPVINNLSKRIFESSFKLEHVNIKSLNQARSLLDVFTHLSELQNGINVYA